jgi:hypothetical protein
MTRLFTTLLLFVALMPLAGCGGTKLVPVSGNVTLDGKPVAEATVTFISDDGKYTASGQTDESGNFTLQHSGKEGAPPGNYKVTVIKSAKIEGYVPGPPEEAAKKPKGADPLKKVVQPGPGVIQSGAKSELPEVYASIEKTPLTAQVPASGPVQLALKSKP